jgi:Fic family protein
LDRSYSSSHPWLTFSADLNRLNHLDWMRLGEVISKCQHIAGVPLKPEVQRDLLQMFVSKGAHGTTAIEGNTLTEEEVRKRIDGELPLPASQEYMGQEIDNLLETYNRITHVAFADDEELEPLTVDLLRRYHSRLLKDQPLAEGVVPGELRTGSVVVGPYRGAPAEDCEYLLERMIEWLEGPSFDAPDDYPALELPLKILRAVLAHLYFAWIHPFDDGNGRMARLIEFRYLVAAGLPLPASHLLSSHYNRTRTAYYSALDRTSRQSGYPWQIFVGYAIQGFQEQLRESLLTVRQYQMQVTWENYVHETFRDLEGPTAHRQRKVVLDMPDGVAVSRTELRRVSARVAEAYAGKGDKTVSRDVRILLELGLIRRSGKASYKTNRHRVEAFLPPRAVDADGHDLLEL